MQKKGLENTRRTRWPSSAIMEWLLFSPHVWNWRL